ncbi:MAG: galactose mutarotase [Synergistaceae bacterium]|jgi:aldose 1-epimerase|nr:galactose mutarotase [Synergistaceae bacterium]
MKREHYGIASCGTPVDLFTLQNRNGVVVRCVNYGCRVTQVMLPSVGRHADVVLGLDDLQSYERDETSQGAFVGRYSGRVKGARFSVSGREFSLLKNDGENFLHGSLGKRVFAAEAAGDESVLFQATSPDGCDGFPGEVRISVLYSLDSENKLTMEYSAKTDAPTHINLTNHSYFDLSAGEDPTIEGHVLKLESESMLEIGLDLCPTGKTIQVRGGAFDFSTPKEIGRDIDGDDPQLLAAGGYDHCFILNRDDGGPAEAPRLAATVTDSRGLRSLRVYTTQPAVQFYTGNFLDGSMTGKGRALQRRGGFCLETQHYPDTPRHPGFPSTLLRPEEKLVLKTVLQFGF